jgi:hypothetical protein
MHLKRRLAVVFVSVLAAMAGSLVASTGAQADAGPQAGIAAWSSFPQKIITYVGNKCLQPRSLAANALIEQRTCDSTVSKQKWRSEDAGGGFVKLRNVASGLCLDLVVNSDAEVQPGVLAQQFYCSSVYTSEDFNRSRGSRVDHFQVWTRIRTSICLEVRNGSSSNGALIQINGCSYYTSAQQFKFVDTF